jgi:hypothetical protein
MKFIGIVALCFVVILAAPGVARAQSILEIAAGAKFCKTLTDDGQRLKCFDSLFAERSQQSEKQVETQANWNIEESKSPIDDSPQITASLTAVDGAVLLLRCKEKGTDVLVAKPMTYLGSESIKVITRINDGKPIEAAWHPSTNGQAVFAPAAIQFIRALPENGKLFIRAVGFNGANLDGLFNLGNVSLVRDKIAVACRWPAMNAPSAAAKPAPPSPESKPSAKLAPSQ